MRINFCKKKKEGEKNIVISSAIEKTLLEDNIPRNCNYKREISC